MDDAPLAPPAPHQQPQYAQQFAPPIPQIPRSPGRPPAEPERATERDRSHQEAMKFLALLPPDARESRVLIYRLRSDGRTKADSRPVAKIIQSEWEDKGLQDTQALREYLLNRLGRGRYQCEPADNQNMRLPKLPAWTIDTDADANEDLMGNNPPQRKRRLREDPDDFMDDDDFREGDEFIEDERPGPSRARNVFDLVDATRDRATVEAANQANTMQTMIQTMMLQQQSAREDDRRRDEARRAEEKEASERRREEARRDEERRREERKEEREREEKRSAERMQMLAALVPLIAPIFNRPKDDSMAMILAKALEPKPMDPLMTMILNRTLEKDASKDNISTMLAGMQEVNKMTSQLQAESMRSVMSTTNELQATIVKKAIETATNMAKSGGGGQENPGMVDRVMDVLAKALPMLAAVQSANQPQPQQQAIAAPVAEQQPAPVQQPPQQVAPTPPPAPATPPAPTGLDAVARCLIVLETKDYVGEEQRAQVMDYMVSQMTPDLRKAIGEQNEAQVTTIMTPVFLGNPAYLEWLQRPTAVAFIQSLVHALAPSMKVEPRTVDAVRDPEDA